MLCHRVIFPTSLTFSNSSALLDSKLPEFAVCFRILLLFLQVMEASPIESTSISALMPIVGVTLYDNGYAVFQRETTIQGQGHIDLYFPQAIMRSVLDSLQFLGEAAKYVGNIAYEATKPTASYEIEANNPLVSLIKSLVGSSVKLTLCGSEETLCGRVLGVDTSLVAVMG